jgi:Baseplate J-like protein
VSESIETSLNNCDCCEPGPAFSLPYNRPGLSTLSYRSGTYATFFLHMLSRLGRLILPDGEYSGTRPLTALTVRSKDDPAIALLDASAVVVDVLTFYQERIADEGFLRTAIERRSILELARAIGYELNPGVAASVYLAFTMDESIGAPKAANIPVGTKVQSVPPQDKLPQIFETSLDITAHAEWNAIRPLLSTPQKITTTTNKVYLDGTSTNLKVGDPLLLYDGTSDSTSRKLVRVTNIDVDVVLKRTTVDLDGTTDPNKINTLLAPGQLNLDTKIMLSESAIKDNILGKHWTDSELQVFITFNEWDSQKLISTLAEMRKKNEYSTGEVHALRTTVGFFGNNAPAYKSLPQPYWFSTTPNFGEDWDKDGGWEIWKDQQANAYYSAEAGGADVYFERVLQGLKLNTWVVFEAAGGTLATQYYTIKKIVEKSLGAFAMSGKVTGLQLNKPDTDNKFLVRKTVAHLQSEQLVLAELPIKDDLMDNPNTIPLNSLVLGLRIGQPLILTGELWDAPGVTESEVLIIKEISHNNGLTELTFEDGLRHKYKRNTVSINANVVHATHGETVTEILGSGNGAQANQKFALKKPPLTYTAAPVSSGSASTLQVRVNNLLWNEAPSLYELGPSGQSYTVRLEDDGKPNIAFGDGERGARLPTGVNNVVVTYRSGIGLAGQVDADSLTILQSRPLGVKGVNNPLPASGAGDPETMERARVNAPLRVRTLDRIVSREDYEDFAAAFAGIGKSQAVDLWSGEHHFVYLTIAGQDGKPITDSKFLDNFHDALNKVRDPTQFIQVGTFSQIHFNLTANIAVDNRYVVKDVFASVETALLDTFSFPRRGFGQGVTTAEVVTIIHRIEGVIFVDIDKLYLSGESEYLQQILTAKIAYVGNNNAIQPTQLLLINSFGIHLQEVKA